LYSCIIQTSFSIWKIHQSNLSENVLNDFLINLGTYLHLNSPSGLIDEFDIKCLCSFILKQHKLPNNLTKNLLNLLESNSAFIVERGLQVYSFQHLSFEEYFTSQAFLNDSSIEIIAKRILSFSIHPRFHESIVLSIGWISFNWSFYDFNQFCQILVDSSKDYLIPLGIFLLFDSFNDIKILPSKSVLINALNSLLNHPLKLIGSTYLLWNLSQLSDEIIIEWMRDSFVYCVKQFHLY
jgi:hypothetical protein